ncbi:hypothetical protein K0B96_02875 [Horticoccus luteus]|uniref:Uncharacterized protein n=1 Tax=Horticoccus luteus TaxID=2862869 RepID=A0A8F9TXJ1_9BACT|nr:hypothetical protein [Horticoccus luteus]QYM79578.1 hypothetical protein K0B96_02875 [Horticoccus luteus]
MAHNPLNKGVLTDNSTGIGPVTRDLIHARTQELASIAGRPVSRADYLRAKRELADGFDRDRQDVILESLPETMRWDPVPGSPGHQALETVNEGEDSEGRSETEQLVDEGAIEAERDKMFQAAQAAKANDNDEA